MAKIVQLLRTPQGSMGPNYDVLTAVMDDGSIWTREANDWNDWRHLCDAPEIAP